MNTPVYAEGAAPTPRNVECREAGPRSTAKWILVLLPLAYFWFRLVNNLRLEWSTNPQYSYGWVVPLLSLGLLLRRWETLPKDGPSGSRAGHGSSITALFVIFAFLHLPTRLIEAATPEWRPIQWSLAVEAVGLTLCAIGLINGPSKVRQFAFPICFIFVAIPWPTLFEIPLIQSLTRVSSGMAVEVLGWLGIPALQHGNLIEVSAGMVGVDEACSGIRSFQTSLMISLFFGELYRMSVLRRLLLIPAGFVLALAFNVCRVTLLTVVAARKGVGAISQYHDPAGIAITIICTAGLWALAHMVGRIPKQSPAVSLQPERPEELSQRSSATFSRLAIGLILWIVCVEVGVEAWYRIRESHLKSSPNWTLVFPRDNPTFKSLPIDQKTEDLLRFDEGKQAIWHEADGARWQAFFCSWKPGRVAGYLAKRHTPEICMPASGCNLISGPTLKLLNVHGAVLPVRSYLFEEEGRLLNVFHCRWEAGMGTDGYVEHESARYNLVRGIWTGRGNHGQKVLEMIASGYTDPHEAEAVLIRQLDKLVTVEQP